VTGLRALRQRADILRHWATASLTGTPRAPARRHLWALATSDGQRLCEIARRLGDVYPGGSRPGFAVDPATGHYEVRDAKTWHFCSSRRAAYYLPGLKARAEVLIDEYLLRRVPFRDGDHVVDIGANIGDFALALDMVQPGTSIHCFEPSPAEFDCLTRNIERNSLCAQREARQIAIWRADEEVSFHVKSASADSSILPIPAKEGEIRVPARRLDTVLEDRPYRLLKLEAEGVEPEILEGAAQSIGRFHYVSADVGFERGMAAESTLPQVTNFLLARGFEVAAVNLPRLVVLYRNTAWTDAGSESA